MRLAGRVSAAIDILTDIFERHRPASEALKDWGKAHRFAGSTDRHAIGTLVYDALRRRNSLAARMGSDSPRALALAVLRDSWGYSASEIADMLGEQHGPGVLTAEELLALAPDLKPGLPAHVSGDLPEWLAPSYEKVFGSRTAEEGAALASRAPVDLRVNTLKATRPQVLEALDRFGRGGRAVVAAERQDCRHRAGNPQCQCRGGTGSWSRTLRGPGFGLAGGRTSVGRGTGHECRRHLRRGRRKDAGARRDDEERGKARRPRPRPVPAAAHFREAHTRRRHQLRGDLGAGQGQARGGWSLRSRGDRRAMLRLRLMAEKARCQMAADAEAVRAASQGAGASP